MQQGGARESCSAIEWHVAVLPKGAWLQQVMLLSGSQLQSAFRFIKPQDRLSQYGSQPKGNSLCIMQQSLYWQLISEIGMCCRHKPKVALACCQHVVTCWCTVLAQVRLTLERSIEDLQRQLASMDAQNALLQARLGDSEAEVEGLQQRAALERGRWVVLTSCILHAGNAIQRAAGQQAGCRLTPAVLHVCTDPGLCHNSSLRVAAHQQAVHTHSTYHHEAVHTLAHMGADLGVQGG